VRDIFKTRPAVAARAGTSAAGWLCLAIAALSSSAFAADWTEYKSGPFRVVSNAGDKVARERLNAMEQARFVLGNLLGKTDMQTVWPVVLVLFPNQREYGPHAVPEAFVDGGSAELSAWTAGTPQPLDWRRDLIRQLIEANAARMPEAIETALADLFTTIDVNATHVSLGAPLPDGVLAADRLRTWAKIQLLATDADFAGKFRVYMNNLQQGSDESVAARNAFNLTVADLDRRVDEYLKAGVFEGAQVTGRALSPARDFYERRMPQTEIEALFAELKAAGKSFPPDSARGLLAQGTQTSLELAAKANPLWGEPHVRLAAFETAPLAKVKELKIAVGLEPRKFEYWRALAEAQTAAELPVDAAKSWIAAERAAPNEADRARMHQIRLDAEQRKTDFAIAEKKRIAEEEAAALQRVKDNAAAEIHAAEEAANRQLGGLKPGDAPIKWDELHSGPTVTGTLTRVDCLNGPLRLIIQKTGGGSAALLIRDPKTFLGNNPRAYICGAQRPARKVKVLHDDKPDAKLGTAGEIQFIEFP
jgi:hypothetical protein